MKNFPEIFNGQFYKIEGLIYKIVDMRVTQIESSTNFITTAYFKCIEEGSPTPYFEEKIKKIIGSPVFEVFTKSVINADYFNAQKDTFWNNKKAILIEKAENVYGDIIDSGTLITINYRMNQNNSDNFFITSSDGKRMIGGVHFSKLILI